MTTRLRRLRVRAPTALVALLALTVCLSPAQADDEKKPKEPIPGSGPLLAELIRDQEAADAIVRGVIQEKKHFRTSPIGLPATRYRMTGKWSKPAREELAPLEFWVPGGRDDKDRLLIPSKGYYDLAEGDPYIVLAVRRSADLFVLMELFQEVEEPGTRRKILADAHGHALGIDEAGVVRRSLAAVVPVKDSHVRRRCVIPRNTFPGLPWGEQQLKAFAYEGDEDLPPLRAFSFGALPGSDEGDSGDDNEPNPLLDTCQTCYPVNAQPLIPIEAWLGDTIQFYCYGFTAPKPFWFDACCRAWNHVATRNGSSGPSLVARATDDPPAGDPPAADHPAFQGHDHSGIAFIDETAPEVSHPYPYSVSGLNGICYLWVNVVDGEILEADILINASRNNKRDFMRTVTHELGHALSLGHECGYVTILPFGTDGLVPAAKGTPDYVRRGDYLCLRELLPEFNGKAGSPAPWSLPSFCDTGTVAAYHPEIGTNCLTRYTYIDGHRTSGHVDVARNQVLNIMGVHLENRGTYAARKTLLTFYLQRKREVRVIGRYHFKRPFHSRLVASYQVRIPCDVKGEYHLGWRLSHGGSDKASGNDVAWLMSSSGSGPVVVDVDRGRWCRKRPQLGGIKAAQRKRR